jgi:hypothetical protein
VARLDIMQRKLAQLDARVARLRVHRRASPDELASDRDALDLVAFNLMLAVQAACDLAAHLDHDTPAFAVTSIAAWWKQVGERRYRYVPTRFRSRAACT